MIYLDTFLYYSVFASSVLIYGIGVNKIIEVEITKDINVLNYLKAIISILSTSMLVWLITNYILMPINLIEFFPLLALLLFVAINTFVEGLMRLTTGKSYSEFIISFLIVLLSIFESSSFLNTILICAGCFASILLLIPFNITFKKRLCSNGQLLDERYYGYILIFFAILILILSVWDIGWLNEGVIQ